MTKPKKKVEQVDKSWTKRIVRKPNGIMNAYNSPVMTLSRIIVNDSDEGEPLEHEIARRMETGEGSEVTSPLIYTEKADGVLPAYNIRADRWEIAIDGFDTISKSKQAKRDEAPKMDVIQGEDKSPSAGSEPSGEAG